MDAQEGRVSGTIDITIPPLRSSLVDGLILSNNVTDATNDIDIAAGVATAYDGTYWRPFELTSAITKRLDAAWAVGTGNGGLDTGSSPLQQQAWLMCCSARRPLLPRCQRLTPTSGASGQC
jgi:hypothetical protein